MYQQLSEICSKENVFQKEPMHKHTTFKTGGEADFFVLPKDATQLAQVISLCKKNQMPFHIVGNGSNLLVSDKGVSGVVICTTAMKNLTASENRITAACGVSLAQLSRMAQSCGFGGLEFACGIPGTVGGGVVMNAGAYDGTLSDWVESTLCLELSTGSVLRLQREEQQFGYRKSLFSSGEYVVLETTFALQPGDKTEIEKKMQDFNARRREKQPLEFPSAGSTFKRPVGHFAGKLIEDAGLKGFKVGGACVSVKHAGFVINAHGATTADILQVISHCRQVVFEKFGVRLETEVQLMGDFTRESEAEAGLQNK